MSHRHKPKPHAVALLRNLTLQDGARLAEFGIGEVLELPAEEAAAWVRAGWAVPA